MHRPLGDALAVLMRELLDELVILEEDRTARAGGLGGVVGGDGRAPGGGQTVGHDRLLR